MNLSVQVFIDREDGRRDVFDAPTDERGHAGFESWRETVWGSRRVRELGAVFLPRLAGGDLCVEPGELEAFLAECALLRESLEDLVPGMDPLGRKAARRKASSRAGTSTGRCERGCGDAACCDGHPSDAVAEFRHTLAERLANIAAAARYALIVGGGVMIATAIATGSQPEPEGDTDPGADAALPLTDPPH